MDSKEYKLIGTLKEVAGKLIQAGYFFDGKLQLDAEVDKQSKKIKVEEDELEKTQKKLLIKQGEVLAMTSSKNGDPDKKGDPGQDNTVLQALEGEIQSLEGEIKNFEEKIKDLKKEEQFQKSDLKLKQIDEVLSQTKMSVEKLPDRYCPDLNIQDKVCQCISIF